MEQYESEFDPMRHDRQARRKRRPKSVHHAKKSESDIMMDITDETSGLEGGFQTTYQPAFFK